MKHFSYISRRVPVRRILETGVALAFLLTVLLGTAAWRYQSL